MNRLIIYILVLLLLSLASCTLTPKDLQSAEQLMETAPDSALHLLQKIKPNLLITSSERAFYSLLMSQALDKNNIKVESDSMISIATRYFKEDDPIHAGYAWFYKARCANNRGDVKIQAENLLKAQVFAEKTNEHKLLGLIYSDKGLIYGIQSQFDSCIIYSKKAYNSFILIPDYRNSVLCLITIGYKYLYTPNIKKSIYYFMLAKKLAIHCKNPDLYSHITRQIGVAYYQLGDYQKAIEYLRRIQLLNDPIYDNNKWYLLANVFVKTNKFDSARYYLKKVDKLFDMAPTYYQLWLTINEKNGDFKSALYYSKKVIESTDSLYNRKLDISFSGMEKKYKYQGLQISNQQLIIRNKQRGIQLLILLITLSLSLILVLLWSNKVKTSKLKVQKQLLEKEKNLVEKEKQNSNLLEQQLNMQNILLSNVEQYKRHSVKRPNNSITNQPLISPILNLSFHKELIASMDIQYNNISKRLKEQYNELTERDILICCLLIAEFDSGMIATILDVKLESIIKQRYRLRIKLDLQTSSNLTEFLKNF